MMAGPETPLGLDQAALDRLMPMHVVLGADGRIQRAGPTLRKLSPGDEIVGRRFCTFFDIRRPRDVTSVADLIRHAGARMQLGLKGAGSYDLKGVISPLPDGMGVFVNLGFGISVVDAVAQYALTARDFAPTDLAIEMLYMVEAKSAVLEESRQLNQRLQGARIAAEEQAYTDTLTGLKNRRAMDHVLARLIASGDGFALIHLDLDFFKDVNDTLGHAAGDTVLQAVARVLVAETRENDTVARIGGDEFVLLVPRVTDPARLARLAARVIARLEEPVLFEGQPCRISGSVGITTSAHYDLLDAERMLADADTALYASKRRGRACHTLFDPSGPDPLAAPSRDASVAR